MSGGSGGGMRMCAVSLRRMRMMSDVVLMCGGGMMSDVGGVYSLMCGGGMSSDSVLLLMCFLDLVWCYWVFR